MSKEERKILRTRVTRATKADRTGRNRGIDRRTGTGSTKSKQNRQDKRRKE